MEIRKPKFELGQKVVDKNGNVETVIKFNSYHFEEDEYWYYVSYDGETIIKKESFLKPYIEKSEPKKKTVWDLKEGEECYWLTLTGHIYNGIWDGSGLSVGIRDTGGCFLNRKEAECEIERRKVETEMLRLGGRREFKYRGDNYTIYYCDGIKVSFTNCAMYQGSIWFDTRNEAEKAIKKIGEDRIKKYIFKLGIACNEN